MTAAHSSPPPLQVLAVLGSLGRVSAARTATTVLTEDLEHRGCNVEIVDFVRNPLEVFNPESSWETPAYKALKPKVEAADVIILSTPDYHGSMSGATKNFLDHFWREFGGKLFASLVSGHEKGLTVADQIRTVARQCYAWSMPYSVGFSDREDLKEKTVPTDVFRARLEMYARDIAVYGSLLAGQRRADLAGQEPGFLARWRA